MNKIMEVSFPGGKKVDAKIDNILIKTDQLIKNGGEGSAPSPFQLFLTSIATCAGFYALQFCQSRNISTEGMSLKMTCNFDPEFKRYKKIIFDLKLPAGFPEKFKKAIIRSMNLCGVKRHITEAPEFEINTSN